MPLQSDSDDPIYVTKPALPPLEEVIPLLQQIWESKILSNNGPLHREFEKNLKDYLDVNYISLFSTGTSALLAALKALDIKGEVITTPYSFVATSHSLAWSDISPVFVDIDKTTFNLNPDKIESAITDKTTAIMPVHSYGIPCDVKRIKEIAEKYKLKVIYDAAHAFGVECDCGSLLSHGDLSVLSFHATKVFNTLEGGAIICNNEQMKEKIDLLKNYGFKSETEVITEGVNFKMNEFQAAVGLLQLKRVDEYINQRSIISETYRKAIKEIKGLRCASAAPAIRNNHAYFPILVEKNYPLSRNDLYEKLKAGGIHTRRYFYPLIAEFPMYRKLASAAAENLPIASQIANQVICLPIYPGLMKADIDRILALLCP